MQPETRHAELVELQRSFFEALTGGPDAVRDPLAWVDAPDAATARARLGIYSGMFYSRLVGVLQNDFPALAAAVGPVLFERLARDYLSAHPSEHGSVRYVGRHVPRFVAESPLVERWPFLADLARLEHARGEMTDAPEPRQAPVTAQALAQLPAEAWAELRLSLVPAHQLLVLDYPVHRLWLSIKQSLDAASAAKPAAERDERETRLEAERAYVVTWRQGVTVYHRAIDAAEHAALSIFAAGGAFAELCEQLELADPAIIVGYLRRWVADGLVLAGTQEKSETEEASPP